MLLCLVVSLLGAVFFTLASRLNYPGGHAFTRLHELAASERHLPRTVHIDVPSAMTGVSHFGEEFSAWTYVRVSGALVSSCSSCVLCRYSKDESVTTPTQLAAYDFILSAMEPTKLQHQFELLEAFETFERVQMTAFPPVLHTKTYIFLMRKRDPRST